jgi:hypothetical protein
VRGTLEPKRSRDIGRIPDFLGKNFPTYSGRLLMTAGHSPL